MSDRYQIRASLSEKPAEVEPAFLPDLCGLPAVFSVLVIGELLAIVLVLGSGTPFEQLWDSLSLLSLYVLWIALGGLLVLCAAAPLLRKRRDRVAGLWAYGLLLGATLLVAEAAYRLQSEVGGFGTLRLEGDHAGFLIRTLAIAAVASALVLRYLYIQYQWKRQIVAESRARFQALQARIRPHFLFNSLNTVASLTRTQPELAERIIEDLADLFRACLTDSTDATSVADELALTRGYLDIEQLRLGDRLKVDWDVADMPGDTTLPSLLLQPLVENAVYHGIETSPTPGTLRIIGRHRERAVHITIENSLPPIAVTAPRQGNQMALDNVRQRLESYFGGAAVLTTSSEEDLFRVHLVIPISWRGR